MCQKPPANSSSQCQNVKAYSTRNPPKTQVHVSKFKIGISKSKLQFENIKLFKYEFEFGGFLN